MVTANGHFSRGLLLFKDTEPDFQESMLCFPSQSVEKLSSSGNWRSDLG